ISTLGKSMAYRSIRQTWARIDVEHKHASQSSFISDELAKLAERPVVQPTLLSTAGHKPDADVGQIFEPHGAAGASRRHNEGLRDHAVGLGLKPPLLSRELAQPPPGEFGTTPLESSAPARVMGSDLFNSIAGVRIAVAVGCAEHIGRLDQFGIIDL